MSSDRAHQTMVGSGGLRPRGRLRLTRAVRSTLSVLHPGLGMSSVKLHNQLARAAGRVRRAIQSLDDGSPLKRWFLIELAMFVPGPDDDATMEELSARMRAVRQLEFMVAGCLEDHGDDGESATGFQESSYSAMSRVPNSLLEAVQQTNFSIEPRLLLHAASPVELFDLVSPTAKIVGYFRQQDDALGFARRLSRGDEARRLLRELGIEEGRLHARLAILFRSRYHAINAAVAAAGAPQVLELAAGISPRGLHWSRQHPGTVYIESDLPALMREKSKVLRDAIHEDPVARRGVLHCCSLDALDLDGLRSALEYTDPETPLVIVTEGLLLYFNAEEMGRFLANMRAVLEERRAVWVVDLVSRRNLEELFACSPGVAAAVRSIFASTSRAVVGENPFQTDECIHRRLADHGLKVQAERRLADATEALQSFPDCSPGDQQAMCGSRKIWTIGAA